MPELTIPYKFKPRAYQLPFFKAIDRGVKRALLIYPRRTGKDKSCFNALVKKAIENKGVYYYIFPEYNQGRKALWDNIDSEGLKTIDHLPRELRAKKNDTEMKLELLNGSIIQIIGAADIDRIVGTNPAGVVFSEYSLMSPMVWGYILPILLENDGFAWFNLTPRGDNHAKDLYVNNKDNPDWHVQKLDAYDVGVFSEERLEEIKEEYYSLYGDYNLFEQEFMCSFESPIQGSYYGEQLKRAGEDGRITSVPYDENVLVHTYWDLGVGDNMAIWFLQNVGKEVHVIDYYENTGEGLPHYISQLKSKGYNYGYHWAPHDIKARELTTGKSRLERARELGINFKEVPNIPRDDGIDLARGFISRCWFDKDKTSDGLAALKNYRKEFDEKKKRYKDNPLHDWASDGADAFRYAAVAHKSDRPKRRHQPAPKRRSLHV